MFRFLKWLAGFVLTVMMVILIAVIVVPMVVNPNDYRDELAALVKDKTGRDLTLDGDLSISVFPWLGVTTQSMSLAQPRHIGGPMLTVERAQLRVKLLPLFEKKVEVDTVVLERPIFRLVTLADGTDSFSDVSTTEPQANSDKSPSVDSTLALVVQGLELSDGSVILEDRQANSRTEFQDVNIVAGNLLGDQLAGVSASARLVDAEASADMALQLRAQALINTETLAVDMEQMDLLIQQDDVELVLNAAAVSVTDQQLIRMNQWRAELKSPQLITAQGQELSVALDSQRLMASPVSLSVFEVDATVLELRAEGIIDNPRLSGRVKVAEFNGRDLLSQLDIDYQPANTQALERVSFDGGFKASLNHMAVQDALLRVDASTLSGSASLIDFAHPGYRFDLELDSLNLDQYASKSIEGSNTTTEVSGGEALAVPMALFRDIDANGTFKAQNLVSGGLALSDIQVNVKSGQGRVEIVPVAQLYDGKLAGSMTYQEESGEANLSVKNQVDLVQLGQLLLDADITDQLRGLGSVDLDLRVNEKNGLQHNSGTIKLLAKEGALTGLDINRVLAQANGLAEQFDRRPQAATESIDVAAEEHDVTEFAELLGTFNLNDFQMTNEDLKIIAPGLTITGFGEFDLAQQTLDYNLRVNIAEGLPQELNRRLEKLKGHTIPIRCRGALQAPSCGADIKALYSIYAQTKLDEKQGDLLQDKYGIEDGAQLSTKEALKQVLIKELIDKDKKTDNGNYERPISERDPVGNDGAADDESAVAEEQEADPEQEKSDKEQLKDDLARKLLDALFD